ncbi:LysR family transcriptional regulator [Neptuniibacter sp. QD37_6]|uniref:LysR family transcriptional regulator n=2 Tax=Neptuniibacter TaxID=459520 RepID=UPI0039F7285D
MLLTVKRCFFIISIDFFYGKIMDIGLLRTFLEVSKTRHFGKAAENLYLTQSAVSFRIRQLEELVGLPLFSRQRNNIMLTNAGERLIPHAENILASWQIALQDVGLPEQQEMHLSLGGISNLWGTFLQSTLPKLAEAFPQISIRTEINSHLELTRALIAGRLDMAVVLDPPNMAELKTNKIGQIELALVTNKNAAKFSDIYDLGYVFVDWGTAFNLKHAKLFKKPVAPVLHTEQSQIALEFLLTNGGAAFLPVSQIESYLQEGQLHLVQGVKPVKRSVYAVFSKTMKDNLNIGPILELLNEVELKPEATLQPIE